jgi:hypothetical protein
VFGPRFELGTSGIWSSSPKYSTEKWNIFVFEILSYVLLGDFEYGTDTRISKPLTLQSAYGSQNNFPGDAK